MTGECYLQEDAAGTSVPKVSDSQDFDYWI